MNQTLDTTAQLAERLSSLAERTGEQQMRNKILKWVVAHKDELSPALRESLLKAVS